MLKKLIMLSFCILLTSCATHKGFETSGSDSADATSIRSSAYQNGMRHLLGRGTEQNYNEARFWFEKASKQDNPYAENELGYMFISGKGVERNYPLALSWYQKAANHGLASAQYNLGQMYSHGMGTAVDKAKARALFEAASAQGFAPAKRALAGARS